MAQYQSDDQSLDKYLKSPLVLNAVEALKNKFGSNFETLLVSDTLDEDGHQYVNLVQKGGGVLGVALVGYTYILEMAGIRFLRLAGTSAGAINTALMTVIGQKKDKKSIAILQYLIKMDFFSFVDGNSFARWLIKNFATNKTFERQFLNFFKWILISLGVFLFCDVLFAAPACHHLWASRLCVLSFSLTGLNLLLIALIGVYSFYLFKRLKASGYGINPGNVFLNWIKERMEENGVDTVTKLNAKADEKPRFSMRPGNNADPDSLKGDVTFITSELVTENKIQLPLMCNLFRVNIDDLHPARFVRASMAIPVFFESHIIDNIPCHEPRIQDAWFNHLKINKADIPETVRFVDGGMLSNFPINLFYDPGIIEPRLPSFGIDLDDNNPEHETGKNAPQWSLGTYLWRLFNTIRYYYDKDFLEKNYVFKKGIGSIKLFGFNWLNFSLTEEDKIAMFEKGAQAASDFLIGFNWLGYKIARTNMQQTFNNNSLNQK